MVLIQLAILTVACLEESKRDHFDKEKVIDQLVEDLASHAWQYLEEKNLTKVQYTEKFGKYIVYRARGQKEMRRSITNQELYEHLRPAIEMNLAWGIPAEKPTFIPFKASNESEQNKLVLDYFAYLYSVEKNKADQIKRDNVLMMVGVFVGIITLTLIASWLLSRFAWKHYLLAKPAQDHARTEPFWEFVTTVFPIITFKTTRWDALKFMKSQFRRRVAMVLLALCVFKALSECQSSYENFRRETLFYHQLDKESTFRVSRARDVVSAESDFHQSILIALILASVMGSLFIVPKHLSRQNTDKGIAPTPAG
jgi:hypothetical protein